MNSPVESMTDRKSAIPDLLNRAFSLFSSGRPRDALATVTEVLKQDPKNGVALDIGGACSRKLGRLKNAEDYWRRALTENPNNADVSNNLGILFREMKRFSEAEAAYRQALTIQPDYVKAYNNLGNLLYEIKRFPEAEAAFRQALLIRPDYAEACANLGIVLHDVKRFMEAEAAYQRALTIQPDHIKTLCNLGILLSGMRRFSEAEAVHRRTLAIAPGDAEAHYNLGYLLYEMQRFAEAEAAYRRTLEIQPDHVRGRLNLGLLLLYGGRFAEGWPLYEARYDEKNSSTGARRAAVDYPQWQGERLTDKSIVIHCEQGFGDSIQFVRYLPLLKATGARHITLICTPPLRALFDGVDGADTVLTPSEMASMPVHDYWAFLLSLPLHLATTLDSIPNTFPYVRPVTDRVHAWKTRLPASNPRIGLVWKGSPTHGNDRNRSLPSLGTLAPLWVVPGITWVSLQKGQGEDEAITPPPEQPLTHLGTDIKDFADSAAIIAQLDLVICVDTAIAHLAGALGKPCWVLLPRVGTDWRWLEDRTDSPWYSATTRLFRQRDPDAWTDTILEVAERKRVWTTR
jgi:Tfp pilus assembly protein PilF